MILFGRMLWLACLTVGFVTGTYYLMVRANQAVPPHLPTDLVLVMLVGFVMGIGIWAFSLVRTFMARHPWLDLMSDRELIWFPDGPRAQR